MINRNLINAAIGDSKGSTFVSARYESPVKLAAAFKDRKIIKRGFIHGVAYASVNDHRNAYEAAVKRDLNASGDSEGAKDFSVGSNWFKHGDDDAYSLVHHPKTGEYYLYMITKNGSASYHCADTGKQLSKIEVAAMMTASAAKKLLGDSSKVENKTHGVTHSVICRTTALRNIKRLRIMGHTLRA